jgi:spore maturation protein SpmA
MAAEGEGVPVKRFPFICSSALYNAGSASLRTTPASCTVTQLNAATSAAAMARLRVANVCSAAASGITWLPSSSISLRSKTASSKPVFHSCNAVFFSPSKLRSYLTTTASAVRS